MHIEVAELPDDVSAVRLQGVLDVAGAQAAEGPLLDLAAKGGKLAIDLGGVAFLASAGLRTMLQTAKACKKANGRVVLFGAVPLVERVLVTAGITALLPVAKGLDAALAVLAE